MGLENPLHIALVLVVVLMVFGAKRLPEMGKGLGEGMRGFKHALSGETPPEHSTVQSHLTTAHEQPVAAQPTVAAHTTVTEPQTVVVETAPVAEKQTVA